MYRVKKRIYGCVIAQTNRDNKFHVFKIKDGQRIGPKVLCNGADFDFNDDVIATVSKSVLFGDRTVEYKAEQLASVRGTLFSVESFARKQGWTKSPAKPKINLTGVLKNGSN